jgi:hypothetical protein
MYSLEVEQIFEIEREKIPMHIIIKLKLCM